MLNATAVPLPAQPFSIRAVLRGAGWNPDGLVANPESLRGLRRFLPENLVPCPLFFRALIFLLGTQVRNIDPLPWMKPPGSGGPKKTHLSFVVLRVSVPPWCKGLVFGCGFVALCYELSCYNFTP